MISHASTPKDAMQFVWFTSSKDRGKVGELLNAVDSFQGPFDVFLCPWNEKERKESQVVLIDFEDCLAKFATVSEAIELIASNLINDRFMVKNGAVDTTRIHAYASLLTGIRLQMKEVEAEYSNLQLAQLVCSRHRQPDNQAVAA
ncbi:MAG: hypothetical protein GQF41_4295 [Candidatus Rifleibacterium amylolyticum]|nr:MAG: hypothetical protein GQF41_4295 [Candidatus Rifleibacterium amylolyticum]